MITPILQMGKLVLALKKTKPGRLGGSVGSASDFGSRHDLVVRGFEPHIGLCADSAGPAWDSPSLSLPHSYALSLSQNK